MSNNEILKIENLKKIYSNTTEPVLKGIDLSIYEGDFLCVLGPSGCGKSTMIRCIAGFEDYEGTIEVSGESVKGPGTDRIMVFQDFNQLFPWKTVLGNITFPLKSSGMKDKKERIKRAEKYLDKVNLLQYKDYYPHQLSGGMKQRVAIAKGMALGSKIIMMDEPFAALDLPAKQDAMQFMRYYLSLGNSIVIASHEEAVFQFCHTVYLLKNGTLFDASHLPEGTNYIDLLRN